MRRTVPEVLHDARGIPRASFVTRRLGSESMADELALAPGATVDVAAAAAQVRLAGWFASTRDLELGFALERIGARRRRLAHNLELDLRTGTPSAAPPAGVGLAPLTELSASLVLACVAAYAPGHPDHAGHRASTAHASLGRIVDGHEVGPMLPCSRVALYAGVAVGAAIVTRSDEGPWLAELFRAPGPHLAGAGAALLSAAIDAARADGHATLGLAVTEGNHGARALYDAYGFTFAGSGLTVRIPARAPA